MLGSEQTLFSQQRKVQNGVLWIFNLRISKEVHDALFFTSETFKYTVMH